MIRLDKVPNIRHLRVQHMRRSMTSSPSISSKRGEVVDEFQQHDGVVTVVVKLSTGLRQAQHAWTEEELELEGDRASHTAWGSWCVLPLSLLSFI